MKTFVSAHELEVEAQNENNLQHGSLELLSETRDALVLVTAENSQYIEPNENAAIVLKRQFDENGDHTYFYIPSWRSQFEELNYTLLFPHGDGGWDEKHGNDQKRFTLNQYTRLRLTIEMVSINRSRFG